MTRGRPPRRPRERAAAKPSLTRCRIRFRSISAKAAWICRKARPAGVVVSIGELSALKAMPRFSRSSINPIRSRAQRPSRSSVAQAASVEAAHAREDVADIINAAIEELVRQRFELPAFGTLVKLATAARATVNRGYHRRIADALPVGVRQRLNALLVLPPGQARTAWDRMKTEPKRPTPRNMRDFLRHLDWLRAQGAGTAVFTIIPTAKARSFAAEARTLTANGMAEMVEPKRLALMAALLQGQIARTLDDLADMFVRQMQRMHARAKEALAVHQLQQLEHTGGLIALLRDTVLACRGDEPPEQRLAPVETPLPPDADAILERCAAYATTTDHGHIPFLSRLYRGHRRMVLDFLVAVLLVSTSQDRTLEQAIAFLLKHRAARSLTLRVGDEDAEAQGPGPEARRIRPRLDLSFGPPSWWPLVTGQKGRDPTLLTVDRRLFELCLFTQVMTELQSGDLCIPGGETYGDYRDQLVPWESYRRQIATYAEQAGLPAAPWPSSPGCASSWRCGRRPSMPPSPPTSTSGAPGA